jgi:predicted O-methyltransferase YrrM
VIVGPALESMAGLDLDGPLDLAFIDADKVNNLNYFNFALDHLRPGGLIIVDNVVLNAHVLDPDSSAMMRSVYDFNQLMFDRYNPAVTVFPFFKKEEDNLDAMLVLQKN